MKIGKVLFQAIYEKGKFFGNHNKNPLLNTLVYDVQFQDGTVKRYGSSTIAENILSQCDLDGLCTNAMEAILDYKRDGSAITKSEKYYKTN